MFPVSEAPVSSASSTLALPASNCHTDDYNRLPIHSRRAVEPFAPGPMRLVEKREKIAALETQVLSARSIFQSCSDVAD